MAPRSRDLYPLVCLLCAFGCNALLGTEEGTAPKQGNVPDAAQEQGDGGGATPGAPADPSADAGLASRNDSKPPCTTCAPELVVNTKSEPKNLRRSGKYLYFTDIGGSYRVDLTKGPCQTADCQEVVSDVNSSIMGVSDSRVCWATNESFACATPGDLKTLKETTAIPSIARFGLIAKMLFAGPTIYAVQDNGGSPATLIGGVADSIAAGTGAFGNVSEPNVRVQAFTLSGTEVAWSEGVNDATVKIKSIETGAVTPIPLPAAFAKTSVRDLALYDKYVFMSAYNGDLYRAPIDGSAAAKVHVEADEAGLLAVNASGIYVGFGVPADSEAEDLEWSPLDPAAPGAAKAKALVSPGPISGLEVADDGIYYAVNAFTAQPAIWRIKFE